MEGRRSHPFSSACGRQGCLPMQATSEDLLGTSGARWSDWGAQPGTAAYGLSRRCILLGRVLMPLPAPQIWALVRAARSHGLRWHGIHRCALLSPSLSTPLTQSLQLFGDSVVHDAEHFVRASVIKVHVIERDTAQRSRLHVLKGDPNASMSRYKCRHEASSAAESHGRCHKGICEDGSSQRAESLCRQSC